MISRRVFVTSGGLALAGGLAARRLPGAGTPARRRVLVVLFQRGAADGLNVVVPFGDRHYAALRPTIAVPPPAARCEGAGIDLDGFFALHPALAPLADLYRAGRLAAVHAVGSPAPTRSHLDAQDDVESATPGVGSSRDGWLDRYLRATRGPADAPLRAVSLTGTIPRSLQGEAGAVALARSGCFEAHDRDALADYPSGALGEALRRIARLIKAEAGVEIACADSAGWDHHTNESVQLAPKLAELGRALAAFDRDLGSRMQEVVVLTVSEFGRAARENGSGGTDHGHGNVLLALGGPVRGGRVYGRWPGLAPEELHEGRDLAATTDFRDVFAEIVVRHLGLVDAAPVFPGHALRAERFAGLIG
jgi:uncharacterized protein (DUF1501 family)